ncbi:MAG TPA: hypothetical protein VKM56_14025 [Verrucomicrobiae bacterium]|nr:hypothetical protein [Verrucomicrobiae bacterium]
MRRQAAEVRDFQRSHKPQRINASLKPHEVLRKTLLDREPDPRLQGNDVATDGGQAVDRAPDQVQAAPPHITERESGQTVAIASVNLAADAAQNTPPPMIEGKGTAIIRSLDTLSLVIVMVVVALGLIKFLFRRTYAKRVLAFGAMRLSQPPPDYACPVDLALPLRNQVEADPNAASSLESVKKALDTIEEAVAEMTSSRQLRSPL